jgi:hypothetical protein
MYVAHSDQWTRQGRANGGDLFNVTGKRSKCTVIVITERSADLLGAYDAPMVSGIHSRFITEIPRQTRKRVRPRQSEAFGQTESGNLAEEVLSAAI